MTAHICTEHNPNCYRCDLRDDERDPVSPDCEQRKCTACTGDAWDLTGDRPAHCACACHDRKNPEPQS